MNDDDERRMLARIAAGDPAALAECYERFRAPLFAYLRLFTDDQGQAEEIVQDTLIAVWRGAARFEGRSSVRGWLFAIARRRAVDLCRKTTPDPVADLELVGLADSRPGPESRALDAVAADELAAAIDRLGQIDREPLLLFFAHGLSYQEVADVLGVPLGTVKSRLRTARLMLRDALSRAEVRES